MERLAINHPDPFHQIISYITSQKVVLQTHAYGSLPVYLVIWQTAMLITLITHKHKATLPNALGQIGVVFTPAHKFCS